MNRHTNWQQLGEEAERTVVEDTRLLVTTENEEERVLEAHMRLYVRLHGHYVAEVQVARFAAWKVLEVMIAK